MDDDMPSIDDLFDEFDSGVQRKKVTTMPLFSVPLRALQQR